MSEKNRTEEEETKETTTIEDGEEEGEEVNVVLPEGEGEGEEGEGQEQQLITLNLDDLQDPEGLTTKQIMMGILDCLNTSNKLSQERNKRLRDLNKILRKIAGLTPSPDRTIQGTPPKQPNTINKDNINNDFTIGLPE